MKNKELFDQTIAKLVKAFLNGTLDANQCYACAVGNICGHNYWNYFRSLTTGQYTNDPVVRNLVDKQYFPETYPYKMEELIRIEQQFLLGVAGVPADTDWKVFTNDPQNFLVSLDQQDQFNGLMYVVDVLQDIHEMSEEETITAKELFAV